MTYIPRLETFSKDLIELIKKRRSVRIFTGEKVPREKILSIIESAIWAPTGCNNQELRFYIMDKNEELKGFLRFKPFLKGVSTVVLVFCDMSLPLSPIIYSKSKHSRHLHYIDAGIAVSHMILYAKSLGIDSCVLNVSEYHYNGHSTSVSKPSFFYKLYKRCLNLITKIWKKIMETFHLQSYLKNNFEYYIRKELKIPKHYKILTSVAFGYAKHYPTLNEYHGGKKIEREDIDFYII